MTYQELFYYLGLFAGSFTLTFLLVPKISLVMNAKKILDDPNDRSSHKKAVPNLGGIAFYIVLMLSFFFVDKQDQYNTIITILPGITILFILGLKDDLVALSPRTKLGGQFLASLFLVSQAQFKIYNFHGFLGIHEVPEIVAILVSVFLVLAIINAFNLIDGIDGLASIVALIIFGSFAAAFFYVGNAFLGSICFVMWGSLIAFLRYNLSSEKKIFMGDTGSMLLGFVIAIMSIRFVDLMNYDTSSLILRKYNVPYILLAVLIVPFFDTLRVFVIRLMNKRGPFSPDRNHIHHLLIDFRAMSHVRASIWIGLCNLVIIILFTYFATFFNQWFMFLGTSVLCVCAVVYFFLINKNREAMRVKVKMRKKS
ncbi:UDP-N-acetylmuramyl pentapeptide phosphotransferase/UDP-N-acetylglucosamine-1-phosphate transferase [Lishizhenia tianjinensis]|uniref:UDP-N-acetylmuramyl pentapeptide phosphotransferase/UDP-N-acetylglucosamine-1-phosphate transferase n=1 Tax=Lishizhenia tianjinensis TaxID=477690 RepID=A0A1I6ZKB2_9FLAO|nr:MraY family glycosyltransferase [Lishizhenia tianjinensis]SFT63105.1 UDP-N-acetylmuramyl pentapeptide phosphotransferase/UDP-N-acetylglucosamine-1-phosphate transferase [Lishizhenia tianjinensis]